MHTMTTNHAALTASLLQQAVQLQQQGQLPPAQALYRQVLEINPHQFDALHLLGVIARQHGDHGAAINLIGRALAVDDTQARAHANLGVALLDAGRAHDALDSHERAITLQPDYALAWSNRGNALRQLQRLDEALLSYQRALALQPDYPEAHCNRAIVLQEQGRYQEALGAAEDALDLRERHADAWFARGNALHCLRQLPDAVDSFERAIALRPHWAEAHSALGASLQRRGDFAAALAAYDRALALKPHHALAHYHRGNTLRSLGRMQEAAAAYHAALAHGDDPQTIAFALASVGAGATPATLPGDYVRTLFDQYANHFDQHLTEVLGYRTPAALDALIRRHRHPAAPLDIVDLGCGTGLCAPFLHSYARRLDGVDLSQQMLDQAADRALYDDLACADLVGYLHGRDHAWDLAVAADVFVYIGDLAPVFSAVHRALRPGGRFCFSVEASEGADDANPDYVLRPSNRYAHTLTYLQQLATTTGFTVIATEDLAVREENGAPLAAHAIILGKPA
jgi:predicted TPR repeat methyltransferase